MSDESDPDSPQWEYRLDVLLTDGVSGFRCPLCGADVAATLDDPASYDRVKEHLLAHDPTLLAGALVEARSWARHGYEIGQESCSWTADSDEPTWMTEQYHAPCAACGWRNGAHADGCAAAGPDEFVIEDGSRTMRHARADDYALPDNGTRYNAVVDEDPVTGSPFWHWRVFCDGALVKDGWQLTSEGARHRADYEIAARIAADAEEVPS